MKRIELKPILDYPVVYILCPECQGWDFMGVDMPGAKRDIKDALYRASASGATVIRYADGHATPSMPACWCGE